MTPDQALTIFRRGWLAIKLIALFGYGLSFAFLIGNGGWEALGSWEPWIWFSTGLIPLSIVRFTLWQFERETIPLTKARPTTLTLLPIPVFNADHEEGEVATVAIVVHGVGDHTSGDILANARRGLSSLAPSGVQSRVVEIRGLTQLGDQAECLQALKIEAASLTHLVLPTVWSRLRPRTAREAGGIQERDSAVALLFRAIFWLLPGVRDSLRCVAAAQKGQRRYLIAVAALIYAVLAPAIAIGGLCFVAYVCWIRVQADQLHYEWWRIPALLIGLQLLRLVARQVLMLCDFVSDVASYVGNPKHRHRAETQLLGVLREFASRYPTAQIVLVGHSLGSVLVTHAVLKLADGEPVTQRLRIVTLGSPLRMMSWFFPDRILAPERLLDQFATRDLVNSWANIWRDADFIGRTLRAPAANEPARFAETSLGDGTHADYWSDPRCWRAVLRYLDAAAEGSVAKLSSEWAAEVMTTSDEAELRRRATFAVVFAVFFTPFMAILIYYVWHWLRDNEWLVTLDPWSRWSILVLTVALTVLGAIYYYFTSRRVGGDGASHRMMLARYRLYWTIGMACTKPAALLSFVASLVLWRSFHP